MSAWRQFCADQDVTCLLCGAVVGKGRDGKIMGFGDANGNRELECVPGCDLGRRRKTWYDLVKSADAAEKHNAEIAPITKAIRMHDLKVFAAQGSDVALRQLKDMGIEPAAKDKSNAFADFLEDEDDE